MQKIERLERENQAVLRHSQEKDKMISDLQRSVQQNQDTAQELAQAHPLSAAGFDIASLTDQAVRPALSRREPGADVDCDGGVVILKQRW